METVNSKRYPIRFVNTEMQRMYEDCRRRGADPNSDLYLADGSRQTGSIDGVCYWRGRDGTNPTMHDDSLAFPCWRAGKDDRLAARAQNRQSTGSWGGFDRMPLPQLSVICEALTQFVENDAVRDEEEPQEIGIARDLLDAAEAERMARSIKGPPWSAVELAPRSLPNPSTARLA